MLSPVHQRAAIERRTIPSRFSWQMGNPEVGEGWGTSKGTAGGRVGGHTLCLQSCTPTRVPTSEGALEPRA